MVHPLSNLPGPSFSPGAGPGRGPLANLLGGLTSPLARSLGLGHGGHANDAWSQGVRAQVAEGIRGAALAPPPVPESTAGPPSPAGSGNLPIPGAAPGVGPAVLPATVYSTLQTVAQMPAAAIAAARGATTAGMATLPASAVLVGSSAITGNGGQFAGAATVYNRVIAEVVHGTGTLSRDAVAITTAPAGNPLPLAKAQAGGPALQDVVAPTPARGPALAAMANPAGAALSSSASSLAPGMTPAATTPAAARMTAATGQAPAPAAMAPLAAVQSPQVMPTPPGALAAGTAVSALQGEASFAGVVRAEVALFSERATGLQAAQGALATPTAAAPATAAAGATMATASNVPLPMLPAAVAPSQSPADIRGNAVLAGGVERAGGARVDGSVNAHGHTAASSDPRRGRDRFANLLAAVGTGSTAARQELAAIEKAELAFQWLYWMLTLTAFASFGILLVALVAERVRDTPIIGPTGDIGLGFAVFIVATGVAAALGAWALACRRRNPR